MQKHIDIFVLTILFSLASGLSLNLGAQNQHGQITQAQASVLEISKDPVFSQGIVGICARTLSGKEIASVNADKMLIPASNMKLITTGAAMHSLGRDFFFKTAIGYDGYIEEGVLHGNLYIIGGADPTLASRDSIATPIESIFRQWEKMVRDAGIKTIEGSIIGDGRIFEGPMEEPTWLWEDIGTYYGAGTSGLTFYENMISFSAAPGKVLGDDVDIRQEYPETPWMEIRYRGTTAEEGTGDQLYMYTSELAPVAEIRGTLALDKGRKRVDCSNKFPELTCASYFLRHLESCGIECTGSEGDFKLETGWMDDRGMAGPSDRVCTDDSLVVIGHTQSPSLQRISYMTNHESNNTYAEILLRTMGLELGGSSLYPESISILKQILGNGVKDGKGSTIKGLGVDVSKGIHIKDGSGLSRGNLVSPDFFCRFLEAMSMSAAFEQWLEGLPCPGGKGTLTYNMKKSPDSLKRRIRMKSGSMNGVRCYSGYILPEGYSTGKAREGCTGDSCTKDNGFGDTIVFSVMVNNCTSPTWKVNPMIDKIIETIAKEGNNK